MLEIYNKLCLLAENKLDFIFLFFIFSDKNLMPYILFNLDSNNLKGSKPKPKSSNTENGS